MMTKPLQEKLIRSRILLPPRISSYGPSTSGNNSNNNDKWIEYICQFIHAVSTIIRFGSPIVIMMAILSYDLFIVSLAVLFGLFIFKILVLDLFLFKMGKIQNWPNKIDIIAATVFALYAIGAFAFSTANIQFQRQIVFVIIVSGILAFSIAIAWLFGYPIGRIFVSDKVENTVPSTHPIVIHFIRITSRVTLGAFILNFLVFIAAKNYNDLGEKEKALLAAMNFGYIQICILLFLFYYCLYFDNNIEKIAAKYDKKNKSTRNKRNTKLEMEVIMIHCDSNNIEEEDDEEQPTKI